MGPSGTRRRRSSGDSGRFTVSTDSCPYPFSGRNWTAAGDREVEPLITEFGQRRVRTPNVGGDIRDAMAAGFVLDGTCPSACGLEVAGKVVTRGPADCGAGDSGIPWRYVSGRRTNIIFDAAVGAMGR